MRTLLALSAVAAAMTVLPAFADSTYNFTLTDAESQETFQWSLSPQTPYTSSYPGDFFYETVQGMASANPNVYSFYPDTFSVDAATVGYGEELEVTDSIGLDAFGFFTGQFLSGPADGSQPTFTPGSVSGSIQCDAELRSPFVSSALPSGLAFFQFQMPVGFNCGDGLQLVVTGSGTPAPPSSVTPEPSSLALLGTGVLGVGTILRRRIRAQVSN